MTDYTPVVKSVTGNCDTHSSNVLQLGASWWCFLPHFHL